MNWTLYDDFMATVLGGFLIALFAIAGYILWMAFESGWGLVVVAFVIASFLLGRLVKRRLT